MRECELKQDYERYFYWYVCVTLISSRGLFLFVFVIREDMCLSPKGNFLSVIVWRLGFPWVLRNFEFLLPKRFHVVLARNHTCRIESHIHFCDRWTPDRNVANSRILRPNDSSEAKPLCRLDDWKWDKTYFGSISTTGVDKLRLMGIKELFENQRRKNLQINRGTTPTQR